MDSEVYTLLRDWIDRIYHDQIPNEPEVGCDLKNYLLPPRKSYTIEFNNNGNIEMTVNENSTTSELFKDLNEDGFPQDIIGQVINYTREKNLKILL